MTSAGAVTSCAGHTVRAVQVRSLVSLAAADANCEELHTVRAVHVRSLVAVITPDSYWTGLQMVRAAQVLSVVAVASTASYSAAVHTRQAAQVTPDPKYPLWHSHESSDTASPATFAAFESQTLRAAQVGPVL